MQIILDNSYLKKKKKRQAYKNMYSLFQNVNA